MFEMTFLDLNEQTISHLTQWDANQEIIITGEFTDAPIVHFCNKNSEYALCVLSTKLSDERIQVAIPNILLCEPYPILVYVYSITEEMGKRVIMQGKIPVRPRVEPENGYFEENHHVVYLAELERQVIELNDKITEAEKTRDSNEQTRIKNETQRQSDTAKAIADCNTAKGNAEKATSDAYDAIAENDKATEEAIKKLNDAIDTAESDINNAIEQAESDIDTAISNVNNSTNTAINNVNQAITNAEKATSNANTAANAANEKVVLIQNLIESMGNTSVEFTEATTRENIVSGETLSVLFGKVKKWFTDIEDAHEEDVTQSDIDAIVT